MAYQEVFENVPKTLKIEICRRLNLEKQFQIRN